MLLIIYIYIYFIKHLKQAAETEGKRDIESVTEVVYSNTVTKKEIGIAGPKLLPWTKIRQG